MVFGACTFHAFSPHGMHTIEEACVLVAIRHGEALEGFLYLRIGFFILARRIVLSVIAFSSSLAFLLLSHLSLLCNVCGVHVRISICLGSFIRRPGWR